MHTHTPARRHFLKLSTRLATLGLTGLGFGPARSWFVTDAAAAPVTDYKALVCVFLFGGNDGNNMIVPVDNAGFAAYTSLRAGVALTPARLLAPFGSDVNGIPLALNNNLAEIQTGFGLGKVAVVLNTGSLERPLTRAEYQSGLQAPSNLFSHSDQALQAQTATSQDLTSGGWGGRLLDVFGVNDSLGAVSVSSPAMFLQSGGGASNVIPPGANLGLSGMSFSPTSAADARKAAVSAMLAMDGGSALRAAANDSFADGLQLAATLAGTTTTINTVFPGNSLGTQLREVAKLIKMRSQIGPGRQVFFCSMGGYDTHTSQDGSHTNLLRELSSALGAFYARHARDRHDQQRDGVHAVGFRPHLPAQWHGHRPRVGQPPVRDRRRRAGRHLRPAADTRARRSRRLGRPRRVDSEDQHVAVRGHARPLVRRLAGRTGDDVPEPVALPDERRRVHALEGRD